MNLSSAFSKAQFLPEAASSFTTNDNRIMMYMLVVSGLLTVGIFTTVIWFAYKYRRHPDNLVAQNVPVSYRLETAWSVIPFLIFLLAFVWGARSFLNRTTAPGRADTVFVLAKQWMWEFEHANGIAEINRLHVPIGRDTDLLMISQDVIHSFFVPAFRVKYDVLPGRYTETWFRPDKVGTYRIVCSQYCGADHSEMVGEVIVMTEADYAQWLDDASQKKPTLVPDSSVERGRKIFATSGCVSCHGESAGQASIGPLLQGRFSSSEKARVREDILRPSVRIAQGYSDVMPSFAGKLSERELFDLVTYLTSASTGETHD